MSEPGSQAGESRTKESLNVDLEDGSNACEGDESCIRFPGFDVLPTLVPDARAECRFFLGHPEASADGLDVLGQPPQDVLGSIGFPHGERVVAPLMRVTPLYIGVLSEDFSPILSRD